MKCFFPNPEAAEKFLAEGLHSLGELTFARWQDLLPTEMGPMLYKELVEMCQNYNSETKFVLYISLCVVSETPASGAIKWERQLVSRCAKLRLSKDINFIGKLSNYSIFLLLLKMRCLKVLETNKNSELVGVFNSFLKASTNIYMAWQV